MFVIQKIIQKILQIILRTYAKANCLVRCNNTEDSGVYNEKVLRWPWWDVCKQKKNKDINAKIGEDKKVLSYKL